MSIFLTRDEVAELTGIKRGRDGKTRDQLQGEQLRCMGVAFFTNASGRPIVTTAAVEGKTEIKQKKTSWQPAVLNH